MQVRGSGWGVAARPHVPDHVTGGDALAFMEIVGVSFEVRVVVAEATGGIVLVDRMAGGLALEQLRDRTVLDGMDRGVAGSEDIDGLVNMAPLAGPLLHEIALERFRGHAVHGHSQVVPPEHFNRFSWFRAERRPNGARADGCDRPNR